MEYAKKYKQQQDIDRKRLELEKEAMLKEMKDLGIEEKYTGDLQKFKIGRSKL